MRPRKRPRKNFYNGESKVISFLFWPRFVWTFLQYGGDDPVIVVSSTDVDSYADVSSFNVPITYNSVQLLMIANVSLAFPSYCDCLIDKNCV